VWLGHNKSLKPTLGLSASGGLAQSLAGQLPDPNEGAVPKRPWKALRPKTSK